jgi:hypothetical protein
MFPAGEFSHKAVFLLRLSGFLWVWIMGSRNVMGLGYGKNTSGIVKSMMVSNFSTQEKKAKQKG